MNRKEREAAIVAHGEKLLAIFPDAKDRDPVSLCKRLRRLEAKAAAVALRLCNGPEFPAEDAADKIFNGILAKVDALLGNKPVNVPGRVPVFINCDPRGYQLKIRDEWMRTSGAALDTDWGGYGIIAPEIK